MLQTLEMDIANKYTLGSPGTQRFQRYQAWCLKNNRRCLMYSTQDIRQPKYRMLGAETLLKDSHYWISLEGIQELWKVQYQDVYVFEIIGTFDIANDSIRLHGMKKNEIQFLAPIYYEIITAHLLPTINVTYTDCVTRYMNSHIRDLMTKEKTIDEAFATALQCCHVFFKE